MWVMLVVSFLFFKEVQSNILSGQAGDSVPSAAETIQLSVCMRGTTSSTERPHTLKHNYTDMAARTTHAGTAIST